MLNRVLDGAIITLEVCERSSSLSVCEIQFVDIISDVEYSLIFVSLHHSGGGVKA